MRLPVPSWLRFASRYWPPFVSRQFAAVSKERGIWVTARIGPSFLDYWTLLLHHTRKYGWGGVRTQGGGSVGTIYTHPTVVLTVAVPHAKVPQLKTYRKSILEAFDKMRKTRGALRFWVELQVKSWRTPYSIFIFLKPHHLFGDKAQRLFAVAETLLDLSQSDSGYFRLWGRHKWCVCAYSDRHQRVVALPKMEMPYLPDADDDVGDLREDELGFAAFFLGAEYFAKGDFEMAVAEEEFALRYQNQLCGESRPNLSHNLACAYSKLSKMDQALDACKQAITLGVDHHLTLEDPDLSELRLHPLWAEVLQVLNSKPSEQA